MSGPVTVHLSDPPTCKAPNGEFNNIWVTVTRVEAHFSDNADDNDPGWIDLADLRENPIQVDLLDDVTTNCFLKTLGTTTGLPVGDYQQIRIHLLSNSPAASEDLPSTNHCAGTGGFNCVDHQVDGLQILLLSSQANTGLKIPSGQIAGGAIQLKKDQAADLNIDFDGCASVLKTGAGDYKLKPTLHAGEVFLNTSAINGRVVDKNTGLPIAGATILVYAEQPDSSGIDRRIQQTLADENAGTFSLCPLPVGIYDIVVAAQSNAGVTYNATILFGVPPGTNVGDIPLVPESGISTAPGEIDGMVSTAGISGSGSGSDVELFALQSATPQGGSALLVTIPVFGTSTQAINTVDSLSCTAGTKCGNYVLFVPPSNPSVGTFNAAGTVYSTPAAGDVLYTVHAVALVPLTGIPDCSPSSLTTNLDSGGLPLKVSAGASVSAEEISFVNCQ